VASIYLTEDVVLSETLEVPLNYILNLCLNGHTLSLSDDASGCVLSIPGGLNLCDCSSGKTGKITGGTNSGVIVGVDKVNQDIGAQFNMYGGSITGNSNTSAGGGVKVCNRSTFNLNGGNITNNQAQGHGGGVFMSAYASSDTTLFRMYGGQISGNTATDGYGGGVYWRYAMHLYGGSIKNNISLTQRGGGVYLDGKYSNPAIGGSIQITDNRAGADSVITNGIASGGQNSNFYINNSSGSKDRTLNFSSSYPFTQDACIGLSSYTAPTLEAPVLMTLNNSTYIPDEAAANALLPYFFSDNDAYKVAYEPDKYANALVLASKANNVSWSGSGFNVTDSSGTALTSPYKVVLGGEFQFKIATGAESIITEPVIISAKIGTAEDIVLTPDDNDVYTISNITADTVITVTGIEGLSYGITLSADTDDWENTYGETPDALDISGSITGNTNVVIKEVELSDPDNFTWIYDSAFETGKTLTSTTAVKLGSITPKENVAPGDHPVTVTVTYYDTSSTEADASTATCELSGTYSVKKIALGGYVTLSIFNRNPKTGDMIMVDVSNVTPAEAQSSLVYQWMRGTESIGWSDIPGATKSFYTVTDDDLYRSLGVTVSASKDSVYTGTVLSDETLSVIKSFAINWNENGFSLTNPAGTILGNPYRTASGNTFQFKVKTGKDFVATDDLTVSAKIGSAEDAVLTPNANGVYTISRVTADTVISVTGIESRTYGISLAGDTGNWKNSYDVTPSVLDINGSITGNSEVIVKAVTLSDTGNFTWTYDSSFETAKTLTGTSPVKLGIITPKDNLALGDYPVTATVTYYDTSGIGASASTATCSLSGTHSVIEPPKTTVRLYGDNRYLTALAICDELKSVLDREKFDTIILASGIGFADAMSGTYLSYLTDAPILLINAGYANRVVEYVNSSLNEGGKVYVLGGEAVIAEAWLNGIQTSDVERLCGSAEIGTDRYGTNLAILNAAIEEGGSMEEILVCSGLGYADSIAASAAKRPILLVKNNAPNQNQKRFLESLNGNVTFYAIGGEASVTKAMEESLTAYGTVGNRVGGANRYETSCNIASRLIPEATSLMTTYGLGFADGISGSLLASATNSAIVLATDNQRAKACEYVDSNNIGSGYVLGGPALFKDITICDIFNISEYNIRTEHLAKE